MKTNYLSHISLFVLSIITPPATLLYAEQLETTVQIPTEINESDYKQLFEHANKCFGASKFDEAINNYKKSLALNPSVSQTHFNLGVAYEEKGDLQNAINSLETALKLNNAYQKAYAHLAKVFKKQNQIAQAVAPYQNAVNLDPNNTDLRLEFARTLCENQEYQRALEQYDILISRKKDEISFNFERANTLNTMNRTEEALVIYKQLIEKYPTNTSIAYNIAYTLKKLNRVQEAMPFYKQVLDQNPNHCDANFGLGLAYLISGDFKQGWEKYEWRWKNSPNANSAGQTRSYSQPLWDGSDLTGKTIFLYGEQGLGDTFQFIRYARVAKERGGKVVVAVQNPLVTFISQCKYIDQVIPMRQTPPHFDTYAPLMSLPYILGTTVDSVPDELPYLQADPTLEKKWRDILSANPNFKIGICWQGNDKYSTPFLRTVVAAKSINLEKFAPLAHIPGVSIYSLQKQTGVEQLKDIADKFEIITFEGDFDESNGRFMDTAAVVKNLDLIISVDTGTAHFAAALGTPTWVFLPNPPDWRWMLERNDTPWYPGMRLFRQPIPGDWETTMATVVEEVYKLLGKTPPTTAQNNSYPASCASLREQLEQELAIIETQLLAVGNKLGLIKKMEPISQTLDSTINDIRTFYLLSELYNTLIQKIELTS